MPKSQGTDDPAEVARRVEAGKRIRSAREAMNLNQEQFAALVGISTGSLSAWERGKHGMTWENLTRLAEITKESTSFFSPEKLPNRDSLEWLSKELGVRLGKRTVQALLEIPEPRLKRDVASIIGTFHLERGQEQERKARRN